MVTIFRIPYDVGNSSINFGTSASDDRQCSYELGCAGRTNQHGILFVINFCILPAFTKIEMGPKNEAMNILASYREPPGSNTGQEAGSAGLMFRIFPQFLKKKFRGDGGGGGGCGGSGG
jgi:hypothetical protein